MTSPDKLALNDTRGFMADTFYELTPVGRAILDGSPVTFLHGHRRCAGCGEFKKTRHFSKRNNRAKRGAGRDSYCKPCRALKLAAWRAARPKPEPAPLPVREGSALDAAWQAWRTSGAAFQGPRL